MDGQMTGRFDAGDDAACLMIRPERTRVLPSGETASQGIDASVEHVYFRGEFIEISARTQSGSIVRVKSAPGLGPSVKSGMAVRIAWSHDDAIVVPDEPGRRE